jgi:hypothetical protein
MFMRRRFAAGTSVPIDGTKGDIAAILGKYGGRMLDIREDVPGRAIVMFQSNHATPRFLRVTLNLPLGQEQRCREKWRALFAAIKSKLVTVDEGIETFDQVFMAWIIGNDGKTIYEKAVELQLLPAPEAA